MRVLGFNYTKVSAERLEKLEKITKIVQNIEFTNVEKDEVTLMKESEILKVSFKYSLKYEPKNVNIVLEGLIIISASQDLVKQALKSWKKKQLDDELRMDLVKLILNKCTLKSLVLEEELGVPHHIKLVKVSAE